MTKPIQDYYDADVAKLNALAAKSAARVEELKAENAKLEKRLAQYGLFCEVIGDPAVEFANLRHELHRVESENEKLRELIADVHEALRADKAGMFHRLILASMEEEMRMHELGIEVEL